MWSYRAPLEEIRFVIEHWLDAPAEWRQQQAFADLDLETTQQILEEAARFAGAQLLPINSAGDAEGCHWRDGKVTTPKGYVEAYRAFVEGGWPALTCDPRWGGQGLPQLLNASLYEMLVSCCHAWAMYPGLANGAYECLQHHGSATLQEVYLPRLVSGEWLATMCLTEAHAGSDVGLLRTRAEADEQNSYRITGNKIFISGGEHDLTDNILHLVLARLPDAPAGTRGISLFLVPKLLDGKPNGVQCGGIEKKMGIKGSATCAMNFDKARGFLIGEPNKGLSAMFVMMNAARLHVALQGLSHAEISHQNALSYAMERRQMRAARRAQPEAAADLIIEHPAIRRILLEQRVVVRAERMLSYWVAHLLDVAAHDASEQRRSQSNQLVSLLTPVLKAVLTENGFLLSSSALQVLGGHGYIHENGVEQAVRDSRIALLYEGTTEIQANDLVMRKILADRGVALRSLLSLLAEEAALGAGLALCADLASRFQEALEALQHSTEVLTAWVDGDRERALRGAVDYQWQLGLVLMAYAVLKAARVAAVRVPDQASQRLEDAQYYFDFVLPQAAYRQQLLLAACKGVPAVC